MDLEISAIRRMNGDMALVDESDEGAPLLDLKFYNEFATFFSDEEKEELLTAVSRHMEKIWDRKAIKVDRRGAIAATKAKNAQG